MKYVSTPALIAAIIGPIQAVLGWLIAGSFWPGFDHFSKTISDLAANDSPVKAIQSSFFILGGSLSIVVALYTPVFAIAGRAVIFISGLTTYGLTLFATPSQETSSFWHRVFAIATFVLMSAWPVFSMRFDRRYPWVLRPVWSVIVTAIFAAGSIAFLMVWRDPNQQFVGLWERLIAFTQVAYLSLVIFIAWKHQRGAFRALREKVEK